MAWFDDIFLKYRVVKNNAITVPSRTNTSFVGCKVTDDQANDQTIVQPNGTGSTSAVSASDIDWSKSGVYSKTIVANATFTFSNTSDGLIITVAVTNSGAYTVTWPTVKWPGGIVPTQTVSGTDVYTFVKVGSVIYGTALQSMS